MKVVRPPKVRRVELMQGATHEALRYVGTMTCGHYTIWPPESHSARLLFFGTVTYCHFCTTAVDL